MVLRTVCEQVFFETVIARAVLVTKVKGKVRSIDIKA